MDKVLTTTLLTMAAVVAAVMVINTMLPALGSSGSSVVSSSSAASDRIKTSVEIIAVSATSTSSTATISVWVKNIGAADILAVDQADVFFETDTSFDRMAYSQTPSADTWDFAIEGSETTWSPSTTLRISITRSNLSAGSYKVHFITNNGVSAKKSFSVS